jgi:hypothetical protein
MAKVLASPGLGGKQESLFMELTLQSLSPRCQATAHDFVEGERVISFLVRAPASSEARGGRGAGKAEPAGDGIVRCDVLESAAAEFVAPGPVVCRWAQVFKARRVQDNPERALKLTAESLFLALSDPANERTVENERLLQVLAMMLERKRVLRPKGRTGTGTGARLVYEHAKAKTRHEVAAAELSPEFFRSIQDQLAALVGGGPKADAATTDADGANGPAAAAG